MNYSIIFKMLSMVLWTMALAFSVCAGVSLIFSENILENEALASWICVIALAIMLAMAFYLPSRNAPTKLFRKEAMCVVGLGWTVASFVGALPYLLIIDCPFTFALFESASGLTTTGASVFGDFSQIPPSLMFWRCMSHWIGGLGVVVFFVAIMSFMGSSGRILYSNEASFNSGGGIDTERIQSGIWKIIQVYVLLSIACFTTFKLCGMGWFDGICHMFSTVSTGGFSIYENSIAHYHSKLIDWAVIVFMTLGGMSFMTLLLIFHGQKKKVFENTELWTYLAILASASIVIALLIVPSSTSFWTALTDSTFQTVSLMTTTGFGTTNYEKWVQSAHVILFIVMVIGGCSGSTSGGMKVSRTIASFFLCKRDVEKSFRPRVVRNISLNGKYLNEEDAASIYSHVVLYAAIVIFGMLALSLLEPSITFAGCISGIVSMVSNVGPAFDQFGPDRNYGFLSDYAKILMSFIMIMGRIEFYAIIVLFMPSLWKNFE